MVRFAFLASAAAAAGLALIGCLSDDTSAQSTRGEDAGADSAPQPEADGGTPDATLPDSGPGGDASPAVDDGSTPDAAPLVCSDAGTGRCLVVLASNQANPASVVLHGGYLYWIEEGLPGRIQRVPVTGGAPQQLATGQQDAFDLTADDTSLYWADEYTGNVFSAPLTGVPDGGSPTLLAARDGGSPNSVAVDATRIYWTDFNAGTIYAAPKAGLADGGAPTPLATGQSEPWDLVSDGFTLYWTNNAANGAVMALPLDGGPPFAVAAPVNKPTQLQLSGATIYFITNGADAVYAAPTSGLDGGAPTVLVATGSDTSLDAAAVTTLSFAYDGTTVYWTTSGNPGGEVRSAKPGGGPATTLATGMTTPVSLVLDTTNLYWANEAFGAVFEMAR